MSEIPQSAIEAALHEMTRDKEACLADTVCSRWPCSCIEKALQAAAPFLQQSKELERLRAELFLLRSAGTFADGIWAALQTHGVQNCTTCYNAIRALKPEVMF